MTSFYCKHCGKKFSSIKALVNLPCTRSSTKRHEVYEKHRKYELVELSDVNQTLLENIRKNKSRKNIMKIIPTDDLCLEIGLGLIPLVEKSLDGNLLDRIKNIRIAIAEETGIKIPLIRIIDNEYFSLYEYRFKIHGEIFGKYKIPQNKYLCLDPGNVKNKVSGKNILDPAFGFPALLINKKDIEAATKSGYVIADAISIIATHLTQIIKTNISKIFSYEYSINILNEISKKSPNLVRDVKKLYTSIKIKDVLERILAIRGNLLNIEKILELFLTNEKYKDDLPDLIDHILCFLNISIKYPRTASEIIDMHKKGWSIERIAFASERSEREVEIIIETWEMKIKGKRRRKSVRN